MSVFDGTFHLQSDQFDRLIAESGAYRGELQLWRKELAAWRELVATLPDQAKVSIATALGDATQEIKRLSDFLDRIDISLPSKPKI